MGEDTEDFETAAMNNADYRVKREDSEDTFQDGYNTGYAIAHKAGYQEGYTAGYKACRADLEPVNANAYDRGYEAGMNIGRKIEREA